MTETRRNYPHFRPIQTRWNDNDLYGHVNNVIYYSYVDTAVNLYLVDEGGLDPQRSEVIGICPESHCNFHKAVAYPEQLEAGLRVAHLGKSSVRYEIGIFREGEDDASATAYFVHVFVDRATHRPVPMPAGIRAALERIFVKAD
jgi:acyl-CoA thioester hydrolase